GIATPADASLLMQLGAEAVCGGSGIFKAGEGLPAAEQRKEWARRANAIVKATTNFDKADEVLKVQRGLGKAMSGIARNALPEEQKLAARGW
ncbi:MAG TPA: pyridoxal 5'-phosphate synthase lyase subunit PdxS, partial [bacterium]